MDSQEVEGCNAEVMMAQRIDMKGERYGRLTVLSYLGYWNNATRWRVRCDCGVEFDTSRVNLVHGMTRSCGCIRSEMGKSRPKDKFGKYIKREK